MVDIEPQVFDMIKQAVEKEYPQAMVVGEEMNIKPEYPYVWVLESKNITYKSTIDTSGIENHSTVEYEIKICTNKTVGKKAQAKSIANLIDTKMIEVGFVRRGNTRYATRGIFVMNLHYRAIVNKHKQILN